MRWLQMIAVCLLFCCQLVALEIVSDQPERLKLGETAVFTVRDLPAKGELQVTLSEDYQNKLDSFRGTLPSESVPVLKGTLDRPGFLTCRAVVTLDGQNIGEAFKVIAYQPEKILPGASRPADFKTFWQEKRAQAALEAGRDEIEPAPDLSNDQFEVWRLGFAVPGGKKIYGFLGIPRNLDGCKLPLLVTVPGASPASLAPKLQPGVINLFMNVHTYKPGMTPESRSAAHLAEYGEKPYYSLQGASSRETLFYLNTILGIDRAVKYALSRPECNGKAGITGFSQGGGMSLIIAGLNPEISRVVANAPALCDYESLPERRPGWPQYLLFFPGDAKVAAAIPYFDAVNFAMDIAADDVTVISGWSDMTCPPASVYSAYHAVPSTTKKLIEIPDMRHEWRQVYTDEINRLVAALLQQ